MKLRRWFQTASIFLLSLGFLFEMKWLCLPILHCHSCPVAVFSCPIGILGHYAALGVVPVLLLGTIVQTGALMGRALCGWVCPFGFLQELLYKIPSPKFKIRPVLRYGRYLVLLLLVLAVPFFLGVESYLFFCRLCPAAALEASLPYAIIQGGFSNLWGTVLRFSILGGVIVLAISSQRIFCRTLCPVGAITSLLNCLSAFSLRHDTNACTECGVCRRACPVDIDLNRIHNKSSNGIAFKAPADCILCLECTHACPKPDTLKGSYLGWVRTPTAMISSPRKDSACPQPAVSD